MGVKAALERFKVALPLSGAPMGADYGVAPSGPEVSHGTDRRPYLGKHPNPPLNAPDYNNRARAEDASNRLWDISEYDKLAPGYAGAWGQEVIG